METPSPGPLNDRPSSAAQGWSWVLAELIRVQQDRKVLAVAGGEGLTAGRRLPGFPGDRRDEIGAEAGEGERDGRVGCGGAVPAVARPVGREGTVKATELSASLPRVLPPGPAWKRSRVAGHSPRGAWSGKAASSCSLSSRMLCVPICPCPQ